VAVVCGLGADMAVTFTTSDVPVPGLNLVKLYDMNSPNSVFAVTNDTANFPDLFSQVSFSVWLCKAVDIRSPNEAVVMQFRPAHVTIVLKDSTGNLLFSGSFSNPDTPKDEYHVAFSVDTEAQRYTFYGNGVLWTPTVSWGSPGEITP